MLLHTTSSQLLEKHSPNSADLDPLRLARSTTSVCVWCATRGAKLVPLSALPLAMIGAKRN
jgi:hypothetical protein